MIRLREETAPGLGRNLHCLKGHPRMDFVAEYHKPGRVMDVACGQGAFAIKMFELGNDVSAIDTEPVTTLPEGIFFRQMDLFDLQWSIPDVHFYDTVLFMEIIEHVVDVKKAIDICIQIVKPDGVILITTPWVDKWDHLEDHVWRFTEESLTELIESLGAASIKTWTDHEVIYAVVEST